MKTKCLYVTIAILTLFAIVRLTTDAGASVKLAQLKIEKRASHLAALAE